MNVPVDNFSQKQVYLEINLRMNMAELNFEVVCEIVASYTVHLST